MGAMYGSKPLPAEALKGSAVLANGMYAVWGRLYRDCSGHSLIDVDVYTDGQMTTLVSMQHCMTVFSQPDDNIDDIIVTLLNSMSYEF